MGWLGLEIVGNDLGMRLEWKPISSESEGGNMDMASTQHPKETLGNGIETLSLLTGPHPTTVSALGWCA